MSYDEYFDFFHKAQNKQCPFRAFTFDVVNSKKQNEYINNHENFLDCILYVYTLLEQEEKISNTKILLKDQHNNSPLNFNKFNNNLNNPMILGDMATYFVYNNSISTKRMIEMFKTALDKFNISYPFHFATGIYETNDYTKGGEKLYKGYMPQILESLSKLTKNIIISLNTEKTI